MSQRPEPRVTTDLVVRIWGMSADAHPFFQSVEARNISNAGALLSGLDHALIAGDIIGVQNSDRKARFRVIWSIQTEPMHKTQVGVQLLEGQECPWKDELTGVEEPPKVEGSNKRKFPRLTIKFPIEMTEQRTGSARMRTSATDVSGHGCYVESQLPLPFGTGLDIAFWIESEKVTTRAVVKASDPGVGMGIEFVGLTEDVQNRLQEFLEKQWQDAAPAEDPKVSP